MRDAVIGHNGGPDMDPIAAVTDQYGDTLSEIENWTDGTLVETEAQMLAVDALLKEFKTYKTALNNAAKERTAPLHTAWKAEVAAVKVYTDDADKLQAALVASVSPFKKKLADEKRAVERAAWEAADKVRREAAEAEAKANAASIDDQRDLEAKRQAVIDAETAAKAASKDKPKGLRWEYPFVITDMSDVLRWMNKNARADLEAAALAYVTKYVREHKDATAIPGVNVTKTQEGF